MADQIPPAQIAQDQETRAEADPAPQSSKFWLGEIAAAQKREQQWWNRAKKVVGRFRDERDREHLGDRRANILWSNTEILKAALFNGLGHPDVRRRFPKRGQDERAARTAAIVLERGLSYCQDSYDSSSAVECAVEDMLLPGRGTAWVVYEADVEDEAYEDDDAEADATAYASMGHNGGPPMIRDQKVELHHVYWQDFLTSPGRKWADVWWVARKRIYSRDELVEAFGEDHGSKIPLGAELDTISGTRDDKDDTFKRAAVWEVWDKSKKQRVYVAEGYDLVLKSDDDPYRLQGFFPCPEPLYGVKTTSSLTPIPEYTLYQDQADELDQITTRLYHLVDALRRRGVYDATEDGGESKLAQLAHAKDNQFLPYKGFAVLMEKGGLKNVFQTEDLAPIIQVVDRLYVQRQTLVQTIYEVTGISDVLRGSSNPNETATAQKIKGQFGSLRLQKRQAIVQRFIRDAYRLKAEIMAEHFTREKLVEMTGIEMPDEAELMHAQAIMQQWQAMQQMRQAQPGQMPGMQAPMPMPPQVKQAQDTLKAVPWKDVAAILRSDERRGYKIDIESDATARVDDLEEKQARIEFVTSMQGYLERAIPAVMQVPPLLPLVRELTNFGVKAFKIGRSMEEAFDDAFDQLGQMAAQQQQSGPPTDPKAEAEAEKAKAETEAIRVKAQTEAQTAQSKAQADAFAAQQKAQAAAMDARVKQQTAMANAAAQQEANEIKRASALVDLQTKINGAMQPTGMPVQ